MLRELIVPFFHQRQTTRWGHMGYCEVRRKQHPDDCMRGLPLLWTFSLLCLALSNWRTRCLCRQRKGLRRRRKVCFCQEWQICAQTPNYEALNGFKLRLSTSIPYAVCNVVVWSEEFWWIKHRQKRRLCHRCRRNIILTKDSNFALLSVKISCRYSWVSRNIFLFHSLRSSLLLIFVS